MKINEKLFLCLGIHDTASLLIGDRSQQALIDEKPDDTIFKKLYFRPIVLRLSDTLNEVQNNIEFFIRTKKDKQ